MFVRNGNTHFSSIKSHQDGLPCILLVQSLYQFVQQLVSGGMQVGDQVDDAHVGAGHQHRLHQTVEPPPASNIAVSQC